MSVYLEDTKEIDTVIKKQDFGISGKLKDRGGKIEWETWAVTSNVGHGGRSQ